MNWTELAVKSVKDVFNAVDTVLGTGEEAKYIGVNPKGDKSYQIDKTAEAAYLKNLPDNVTIVSEESEQRSGTDAIILLDPICGSVLAKRGSKYFATGISVLSPQLKPICEAIGIYETRDIYHADESGAFKNGKPIHVSDKKTLEDSIINYESHTINERLGIINTELIKKGPTMFSLGTVKLSLAMLSEGVIDGFVCAYADYYPSVEFIGSYLVEKAGGVVSDRKGNPITIYPDLTHTSTMVCASTKELHAEMLKLL